MDFLINSSCSVAFAILFNIFINKSIEIYYKDMEYNDKYTYTIFTLYIFAIIAIILSYKTYKKSTKIKKENNILSNGLFFGGLIMLLYTLVGNWHTMENETKLVVSGLCIGYIIYYASKHKK